MRRRRSETFAEKFGDLVRENTYGGTKDGIRETRRQEIPVISNEDGIKLEWDNRSGEYPTMIQLRMTDGQWVKYQIFVEQPKPQISPALKDLEKMGHGYVRRRRS